MSIQIKKIWDWVGINGLGKKWKRGLDFWGKTLDYENLEPLDWRLERE
jgi:hypothetical protein